MNKRPSSPCHSVRPPPNILRGVVRGRAGSQIGVRGVGEIHGSSYGEMYPVDVDTGAAGAVENIVVEAEEESQPVDSLPSPYMPTQSERDDHDLTHAVYRSWCKHCVEGRGVEQGHRLGDDHSERGVAIVGFVYMFLTAKDLYTRKEWAECDEKNIDERLVLKVLVVRDMRSKSLFAHAVAAKGSDANGYAAQCIVDDVVWLGYSRVILKSDNEPAIVRLLKDSLKALRVEGMDRACEEHPPPYDPQSNGGIEIGVKLVKGQMRTMRSSL